MSKSQDQVGEKRDLIIYINGSEYHPLKAIAGKDQLLEMAELDARNHDIFLLDEQGKKSEIENDEGVQLQGGMRFLAMPKTSS